MTHQEMMPKSTARPRSIPEIIPEHQDLLTVLLLGPHENNTVNDHNSAALFS